MALRQPARPSDEEVRGAVIHALATDGRIRGIDIIHVEVADGSVLLSGEVATDGEKRAAGEVAQRVRGVRQLDNHLTVAVNRSTSDEHIREAVLQALGAEPSPINAVGAEVTSGVVTLVGRVPNLADAHRAADVAAGVIGVEEVRCAVEIQGEPRSPAPIRADDATLVGRVAQALSDAGVLIHGPAIRVEQAIATVSGVVDSEADRQRALAVVESVEGIRAVRNRLRVLGEAV